MGGNLKESPGKEVEVVWRCVAKTGALVGWRATKHKDEGLGENSWQCEGLSREEVYDRTTWKCISSCINPT